MSFQKGYMEQRRHERVNASLKITYRILDSLEKDSVIHQPRYSETKAEHLPSLSQKFQVYHAVTRDISEGGLSIMGEQAFAQGQHVEISILLPQYNVPVTFLTEVIRATSFFELGKTKFSAGVKILALNREDMDRLMKYLLAEKLKQQMGRSN